MTSKLIDLTRDVLAVVQAELTEQPGRAVLAPGAEVAWDDCCEGQLAVRVVSSTPQFQRNARQGCPVGFLVTLGVSLVRCVSTVNDQGQPPSPWEMDHDGETLMRDMGQIATALQCFKPENALSSYLGEWAPAGPLGGCAGGVDVHGPAGYGGSDMAKVRVEIDRAKLDRILTDARTESSHRGALATSKKVKENITRSGRVDTGRMRNQVSARKSREGWWMVQGSAPYTGFQEFGTGPRIYPKGKFLVFKPKGSNSFVFAKSVRGVSAGNFFKNALASLSVSDFLP